jgi:8-oxo-dGTP diphosphatase
MFDSMWVVVGLIERGSDILIAKRSIQVDHGGLWEFPGGKREANESGLEALTRELKEELGIRVTQADPCFQFEHSYPDKTIFFDCWRVSNYVGEVEGREGQDVKWVDKSTLTEYDFPAANSRMIEMFAKALAALAEVGE